VENSPKPPKNRLTPKIKIQEIFRMKNVKKKRGRPPKNPLSEVAELSAEGAVNLELDKNIKS